MSTQMNTHTYQGLLSQEYRVAGAVIHLGSDGGSTITAVVKWLEDCHAKRLVRGAPPDPFRLESAAFQSPEDNVQRIGDLVGVDPDQGGGDSVQPPVKRLIADAVRVREAGADQRRGELPEGTRLEDHPFPQQRLGGFGRLRIRT